MKKGASISNDNKYRYSLFRSWRDSGKKITFIGLNPSTADHVDNDQTITKLINYAQNWGYGGFKIVNIFAYRTSSRDVLKSKFILGEDIYGPDNWISIKEACRNSDMIMAMWGKDAPPLDKDNFIGQILQEYSNRLWCFQCNVDGTPTHPLYLGLSIKPKKYG